MPIPLGGIVVNRRLPVEVQEKVNRVMARSVEYAQNDPDSSFSYVLAHAQEMEKSVMYQHIGLYVNNYTRILVSKGGLLSPTCLQWLRKRGSSRRFTNLFL
jgi:1,4-dihydroxy-6-naphthoate synthase